MAAKIHKLVSKNVLKDLKPWPCLSMEKVVVKR